MFNEVKKQLRKLTLFKTSQKYYLRNVKTLINNNEQDCLEYQKQYFNAYVEVFLIFNVSEHITLDSGNYRTTELTYIEVSRKFFYVNLKARML